MTEIGMWPLKYSPLRSRRVNLSGSLSAILSYLRNSEPDAESPVPDWAFATLVHPAHPAAIFLVSENILREFCGTGEMSTVLPGQLRGSHAATAGIDRGPSEQYVLSY
jgi:hypothetical protein